jgi:general secretion pathway protein D
MLVLIACCLSYPRAQAGRKTRSGGQKTITIDFNRVDIKLFIKFISELTGKNFVVDNKVRGKVTVLSPAKISLDEAYRVFESVLEVHGFTAVPAGRVTKIVPSVTARQKGVETRISLDYIPKPEDRIITQIAPLNHANARDVRRSVAPLVSKRGVVVAYEPTDVLIINDFESNIQRLLHIIKEIDIEFQEAFISTIHLEYADAEKLVDKLSRLLETKRRRVKRRRRRRQTSPLKIVSYERINVLIVLADEQNTEMIHDLVQKLDQPTPKGAGNIQVVYLENAQAEELAKVLSGISTKAPPRGKKPVISTDVKIVADKATNSLVITAKPDEFNVLQPIIAKLDITRKQVFVEALIMEVSPTEKFDIGVNWNVAGVTNLDKRSRDAAVFAGANTAEVEILETDETTGQTRLNVPSGFTAGIVSFPTTVTVGGTELLLDNLNALINMAESYDDFNIISTPQLMTLDNEEATVVVADNIPFSTRVDQGTATNDRAIQSLEYRDVGVTLKVTPQINEKRFVKLKIYQEVSRVVNETVRVSLTDVVLAPTTRKRTAETNVEVKDGQTVVIAGLIGEDSTSQESKVPCLGDMPVLGWLFKSRSSETRTTNLLIFVTPYIVASPSEADEILQRKQRYMDELQQGPGEVEEPEQDIPESVVPGTG